MCLLELWGLRDENAQKVSRRSHLHAIQRPVARGMAQMKKKNVSMSCLVKALYQRPVASRQGKDCAEAGGKVEGQLRKKVDNCPGVTPHSVHSRQRTTLRK